MEPPEDVLPLDHPGDLGTGSGTDTLTRLSALEADQEAQERLLASVEQSQQRLLGINLRLMNLREELRDVRRAIVQARQRGDNGRSAQLAATIDAQDDLVQAEVDATYRHVERVKILESHLASMREVQQRAVKAVEDGRASELDRLRAVAARLDAEIRLHTEQYPATTPEQLGLLHRRASRGQAVFNEIHALSKIAARGGESSKYWPAAKNLAQWRAELEFARGEYDETLKYQRMARDAAEQAVEATQQSYDFGMVTLDLLAQAQTDLLAIEMKLIEWEIRHGEWPPVGDDGQPVPASVPQPAPRPVIPTPR